MLNLDQTTRVAAFCTAVSNLHTVAGRPFSADDPRLALLREWHIDHHGEQHGEVLFDLLLTREPEHIREEFFRLCLELPPAPFDTPTWAANADVRVEAWPEVMVTFKSRIVTHSDTAIWWEHQRTILVEASEWPDCGYRGERPEAEPAGKVIDHGFDLIVKHNGSYIDMAGITAVDVKDLGEAFIEAATIIPAAPAEIHRTTEPGEPDFGGVGGGL